MPVPVLILGQGLTLLGTVRCFGRAGIPAYVLTGPDPLAGASRWYRAWPAAVLPPYGYDALAGVLARLDVERAVLVPCSDRWAAVVGQLDASLAARFPSVVAPPAAIEILVDKGRFSRLLQEAQVPHPRTFEVSSPADLAGIPDEVLDGGFLKPRDSVAFYGTFQQKAFDFQGRAEAGEVLARTHAAGLAMMLQEYIPGPADQHYFVDGVVARDGSFPVLFARRRLRIHPPRFGNSTALISVPLDEVRDAVSSLAALAPRVGLRGIFSAEFKRDPRDGRCKLIEVNPRPWWYIEFAATCGADVCVPAYRDALGLPPAPARPYRVGVRLVYPYYDWPAWRQSATPLAGLLRFWFGATQAEWRADDPWPAITTVASLARGWVARRLRGTKP
jgi:D-aspartate ligase